MYDEPPQTFEELMEPFPPEIREVAEWLRSLLLSEFPQLDETIHGGLKVIPRLHVLANAEIPAEPAGYGSEPVTTPTRELSRVTSASG